MFCEEYEMTGCNTKLYIKVSKDEYELPDMTIRSCRRYKNDD